MRVLVVTNMYPTEEEPFFGSFVKEQVDDVRSLGVDVDVYDFDGRRRKGAYAKAVVAVARLAGSGRYDLVHAHYGLSGAVAMVQRRLPVVTTFHGSDTGYKPWQREVSRAVARATVPVLVDAAAAARIGVRAPALIPCGVDLRRFVPRDRAVARGLLGLDPTRRYVLFPSNPRKRVKRFDVFEAAFAAAVARVPALAPLTLEGYDRDQVALAMSAADVVVLTSDSEGSPVVVKEALACDTPVVSVDVGDVRATISGLVGCSIRGREPEALADGIVDALDAPRSGRLRRRAERYGGRAAAARIVALYASVLQSHSRTSAAVSEPPG